MGKSTKAHRIIPEDSLSVEKIVLSVKTGDYFKKYSPKHQFLLEMLPQPDDVTCGPTCLHAVYKYYGDKIKLSEVIEEVHSFDGGGTLAVWLACHALKRGYDATIYTYNLQAFDPSWFKEKKTNLYKKLKEQMVAKQDPKLTLATQAYLEFLKLGGKLAFEDLSRDLLRYFLMRNIPILSGLSSTFLYREMRDIWVTNEKNDVLGEPTGHFVVLTGYERNNKTIFLADPYETNPYHSQEYEVPIDRVICSILLGVISHDANFLIITPKAKET